MVINRRGPMATEQKQKLTIIIDDYNNAWWSIPLNMSFQIYPSTMKIISSCCKFCTDVMTPTDLAQVYFLIGWLILTLAFINHFFFNKDFEKVNGSGVGGTGIEVNGAGKSGRKSHYAFSSMYVKSRKRKESSLYNEGTGGLSNGEATRHVQSLKSRSELIRICGYITVLACSVPIPA